jgi:hypothetical protein
MPVPNDEEPQCDCEDVGHEKHCPQCLPDDRHTHLKEHCVDVYGNIYTITVKQVKNTAPEFSRKNPDLVEKLGRLICSGSPSNSRITLAVLELRITRERENVQYRKSVQKRTD